MIDYKSPITIIEDQLHNQIITDYENGIMKALMRYQIHVDKEELLKALQYDRGQYEKGYQDGLNADKWIPCEERLPENLEQVLVWYEYFRYGDYNCMYETYGIGYQLDGFWSGDVSGHKARCIAWQPLPQPYKKEGAE